MTNCPARNASAEGMSGPVPGERPRRRHAGWKQLLLAGIATGASLVLAEIATRVYFAFEIGPRVLLYGTDWFRNEFPDEGEALRQATVGSEAYKKAEAAHLNAESGADSVEKHGNARAGYTKFFKHESKTTRDVDTHERIPVTINAHGFRGEEFETQKPAGVIRIVTLGASSTFGFYNRDEETYPAQLARMLNERAPAGTRFEVLNLAIPHAGSGNIAALFLAEAVPLEPDVVTFYEGRNDSVGRIETGGAAAKIYSVLVHRLLLVAYLDQLVNRERISITGGQVNFETDVAERTSHFLGNLDRIAETCSALGIQFIVANQQATGCSPMPRAEAARAALRGVSYQDETRAIRERMDGDKAYTTFEYSLLVHEQLMASLRQWAADRELPFVDVISALDDRRDLLLSWVHLHPEANRRVAAAFADRILEVVAVE